MTVTLLTVFIVGFAVAGMIFGGIDASTQELADDRSGGGRFEPPQRWVRTLMADGLEHTVVVAPLWHPFTEPVHTSGAQMFRGIRIVAVLLVRTVLRRREWRVAVLRRQTNPVRYHEHLVKETHPNRDAAFARASEMSRSLSTGEGA
jgi:hypothetical protein